jgi:phage-related minor tail protein
MQGCQHYQEIYEQGQKDTNQRQEISRTFNDQRTASVVNISQDSFNNYSKAYTEKSFVNLNSAFWQNYYKY